MELTPIHKLIYELMDNGQEVTLVIYLGHYDEDNEEDVMDAAIYRGHPFPMLGDNKTATVLSEVINMADFDEAMVELHRGLPE